MDEDSFKDQAECGDLILGKFKKNQTKYFDQICMVVNLQSHDNPDKTDIYIFRVGNVVHNKARGIILEPWDDFRVYKNQNLQDCWYRPLYCERNDQFLQRTQNFVKKIREKPYVTFAVDKVKIGQP